MHFTVSVENCVRVHMFCLCLAAILTFCLACWTECVTDTCCCDWIGCAWMCFSAWTPSEDTWVLEGSPNLQTLGTVLVNMKTDRRSRSPGSNEHYKERRRGKKHKNVNLSSHAAVGLLQIIAVWGDEPVCHLVSSPILLSQDPNVTDINSLVVGRWHGYIKKFYEKRKVWTLFL